MKIQHLIVLASVAPLLFLSLANCPARAAETRLRAADQYREVEADPPAATAARDLTPGRTPGGRVTVGGYVSVQVNVDAAGMNIVGDAANETSIAVDPTNPDRIVIGWRQFDNIVSNFRQGGWAYSEDGGASWTFPGVLTPGTFRSDPVIDVDNSGNFYYDSLQGDFDVDVFKSFDGGVTWGSPVPAFGGDKNWMVVDRSGGAGDGHVYGNWQLAGGCCGLDTFTRSTDGGQSFETPVLIDSIPVLGTMSVGPDGEVYVTGSGAVDPGNFLARSDDAQFAQLTPTWLSSSVPLGGDIAFGGAPNPGGLMGQVNVSADPSSPGTVYVLSSVDPSGSDPLDVHLARSVDGGESWVGPLAVVEADQEAWQWFGTLSVSPEGRLDVVWNDTQNTGDDEISELYYAFSNDGGDRWSTPATVSPPYDSTVGWPNQNKMGDYYEMVSDRTGASLAYAATFNGEQDAYFVRLYPDCNSNGVSDVTDVDEGNSPDLDGNGLPDECELFLSDPTPGQAGEENTLTASAGSVGETVFFLFSRTVGETSVPTCPGLSVLLDAPTVLGSAVVGADGTASITFSVPDGASGQIGGFQAVEQANCTASGAVQFQFP